MTDLVQIQARIANQSIDKLQEMAMLLSDDFRDGSEYVMSAVLSALEAAMTEAAFISFCETI